MRPIVGTIQGLPVYKDRNAPAGKCWRMRETIFHGLTVMPACWILGTGSAVSDRRANRLCRLKNLRRAPRRCIAGLLTLATEELDRRRVYQAMRARKEDDRA